MAYLKNDMWPGWETLREIGHGGFGTVYEIQRSVFDAVEKAALKVITIPQDPGDIQEMYSDGYDDESVTDAFHSHLKSIVAEYSLMRKMNGTANIVNCDDVRYVQHDDGIGWDIYIKMELLTPLLSALPKEIPVETTIAVAKDLCAALVLCKKHNIIHRDIKPQNIFISDNGDYKLGDFGIAKTVEKTTRLTKTGTYRYMSPEVFLNKPVSATADIYSLGMVMYWMLNHRRLPFLPPFPEKMKVSDEETAKIRRFSGEPLPPPAHGSEALKQIVLKACAFNPKDRFHSAEEMLNALNLLDASHPAEEESFIDDDKTIYETALPKAPQTAAPEEEDLTLSAPHLLKQQEEQERLRKEQEAQERLENLRRQQEEEEKNRKLAEEARKRRENIQREQKEQNRIRKEEEARLLREQERLEREQERIRQEQQKLIQAKKELENLRKQREEEEENRKLAEEARKRRENIQRAQAKEQQRKQEVAAKQEERGHLTATLPFEKKALEQREKEKQEQERLESDYRKNKKIFFSIVGIALAFLLLSPILSGCWYTDPTGDVYYYIWGIKATGFHEIDGDTYHFYSSGVMAESDWIYFQGEKYYFDSYGRMVTGGRVIKGKYYLFDSETGALLR